MTERPRARDPTDDASRDTDGAQPNRRGGSRGCRATQHAHTPTLIRSRQCTTVQWAQTSECTLYGACKRAENEIVERNAPNV